MQTKEEHGILMITENPPGSYSPASERLFRMALASGSVFDKVVLLSLRSLGTQNQRGRTGRVNSQVLFYVVNFVRAFPYPLSALFDPIKFLVIFVHGFMLCKRYKFSCVAASMPPLETGASAWLLGKFFRVKLLIDLMDDWESVLASQLTQCVPIRLITPLFRLSNAIYSSSNSIFVVTPTLAKKIQVRKIKAKVILAPNGADTSLFYPRNEGGRRRIRLRHRLPTEKIILIYSGSGGNPYYRLDLVLSSIKSLPNEVKKWVFLVFYLYDATKPYIQLKNQLGLPDSLFEIRKPMPRRDLAEVLAACDIGLVPFDDKPYLQYATSTKLYEYASAGLFIVGTGPKKGELASFLSINPVHGIFTQPRVNYVALGLSKVVQNKESLFDDDCRNRRHLFIRENYDIKKMMTKVMKTFYTTLFD